MSREDLQCTVHPLGTLKTYKYVVVCSFLEGKPILSRHAQRDTWETQGGHIEPGESPADAARRELYEESGVTDAEIIPVCDYYGCNGDRHSNGVVFAAKVRALGELPGFEMKEVRVFDHLPDKLTYPAVTPRLFAEAEAVL